VPGPRRTLTLAALAALPACATTTRTVTAVAPTPSSASERVRLADAAHIRLDDGLRLQLCDAEPIAGAAPSALGLTLVFEPKWLGYSFHAGQLVLRGGNGRERHPVMATAGWMRHGACDTAMPPGESLSAYLPLARGSCMVVRFDRAPAVGERLELVVAGAAVGKRRLAPTTVAVARVERTSRRPGPAMVGAGKVLGKVLEVTATILLAPLAASSVGP
jgi:hypothetical protein